MHRFFCRTVLPVALACAAASAGAAQAWALPPAQTVLYAGTDARLTESTGLNINVYSWAIGADKAIGIYAGPSWTALDDKLSIYLRLGGYVNDIATPLINFELCYEDGDLELDLFNDVYSRLDDTAPVGVYSWLTAYYWHKGLYFGAMADVSKDKSAFQLNAGPAIGIGNKTFNLAFVPIYSVNDPKDEARDGLGVRVLVNFEFKADEDDKPCCGGKATEDKAKDDEADGPAKAKDGDK